MKFKLVNLEAVDCSSDPHVVSITGVAKLCEILTAFCESDLVEGIRYVKLEVTYNGTYVWKDDDGREHTSRESISYVSDQYTKREQDLIDDRRGEKSAGKYAEQNKTAGMYYFWKWLKEDGDVRLKIIPDGLRGVREASILFIKHLGDPDLREIELTVEVNWKWFRDDDSGSVISIRAIEGSINFENMDNLIASDDYGDYIKIINKMLSKYAKGVSITPTKDFWEAERNRGERYDPSDLDNTEGGT